MPSVGKYYWSREFMNINSTTFLDSPRYVVREWEMCGVRHSVLQLRRFTMIKFINLGIMLHKKRSGLGLGPENIFDEYSNFSANAKDLLETLPEGCKDPIYGIFIRRFGRFVKANKIKLPWYVPRCYGGVGLVPYGRYCPKDGRDFSICSLFQKKGETFMITKKESNWILHKRFLELIDACNLPLVEDSPGYDEFYGRTMVNMYLAACSDGRVMKDLWCDSQDTTNHAIRRAEKRWRWAERLTSIPSSDFDPWLSLTTPKRPLILESDWNLEVCDLTGIAPYAMLAME
jgi:hypothetical protein